MTRRWLAGLMTIPPLAACLATAALAAVSFAAAGLAAVHLAAAQGAQPSGRDTAAPASGQAPAPAATQPPTSRAQRDTAALIVDEHLLTIFRASLATATVRDRLRHAVELIRELPDSELTDSVTLRSTPIGTVVGVGGRGLFAITPADLDSLRGETISEASQRAKTELATVLNIEREDRSASHIIYEAVILTTGTLVLIALIWLAFRARGSVVRRVQARETSGIRIGGLTLLDPARLKVVLSRLATIVAWVLSIIFVNSWLTLVLARFPVTQPIADSIRHYVVDLLVGFGAAVLGAIPGLIAVAIIIVITRSLSHAIGTFFRAIERREINVAWLPADTALPTRRLVQIFLWLFAIVLAYPYLPGSGSEAFKGVSVFTGLVISLGSAGLVNQAMSGLVLMYARAFAPGDYVRIGDTEGTVVSLGLLSTKIATFKDEEVTIPNAVLVAATTKNFSRSPTQHGVLLHTSVTIGYNTPWRQVHELLRRAALRTPGLSQEPTPFVLQRTMSDFYIEYEINAYLERPSARLDTLNALHANIQDSFNEFGVQIMSPHYLDRASRPIVVPPDRESPPPAPPASEAPVLSRELKKEP